MRDTKNLFAQRKLPDDESNDDVFDGLIHHIRELPVDQRGIEALRLTSRLLEFAAFELAGTLGSEKAGAMIEFAAQLSDQSTCQEALMTRDKIARRRGIQ